MRTSFAVSILTISRPSGLNLDLWNKHIFIASPLHASRENVKLKLSVAIPVPVQKESIGAKKRGKKQFKEARGFDPPFAKSLTWATENPVALMILTILSDDLISAFSTSSHTRA